jgi:hypothetical protein
MPLGFIAGKKAGVQHQSRACLEIKRQIKEKKRRADTRSNTADKICNRNSTREQTKGRKARSPMTDLVR